MPRAPRHRAEFCLVTPTFRACLPAIVALALPVLSSGVGEAQAPEAKPDSPAVQAIVGRAKAAAGAMWAEEARFFCEAPRANSPNDPPIEPAKIFDNVYVIGNAGTVVYVIRTSAGLVMIDALGANQVDSVLLPGFKALGLDPAQVKAILIGHGHADHFGGSAYMQEHYGSRIYISEADWSLMENPPPARGGRQGGAPTPLPKRDQILAEGQPIAIGDVKVQVVAIPGHTPGSMGFIFPVKDDGKTRMAALYGGTVLTPGIISDEGLQTYLRSVARFKEATREAGVEVEIQNHPLMDPIQVKLDRLRMRTKGQPNPFVVGTNGYQAFLDVMSICTEANIARRKT
jgi:metallo-beta-lactamase class B